MFSIFKILIIHLIIPSIYANISPLDGGKTTLSSMEQVKKLQLDHIEKNLEMIVDPQTSYDKKLVLKGEIWGSVKTIIERAVMADKLLIDHGASANKKKLAEAWAWFELMREQIEYYEESNFPQPYDNDFESKKIVWDRERLKGKSDHKLHEERRYQKFKYYLEHPPNEVIQKLRNRLDSANVSVETFSKIIAKAYRLISAGIHDGYMWWSWLSNNLDDFFHQEDVLIVMGLFLDEMGISKKLIEKMANSSTKNKGWN